MIRVFLNNFEISQRVEVDLSFVEKLDMELDEGFIMLSHSNRADPYDMFSTIDIYEDDNLIFTGKISQDNVNLSSFSDELYNHKITIIEHTKILEKYLVTGKTFTQPTEETFDLPFYTLYDVVEILRKTTKFKLFGNEEVNTPFNIPTSVKEELEVIVSPEFTFKDVTLRQALNEVFFYLDAIVRLDRDNNLVIEKFNDLKREVDFLTENYKKDQNIMDYATTMSSDIINSVNTGIGFSKYNYEYYPGKDLWINPRSTSLSQFDFEQGFVPTPKPIYKIEDLYIGAELKITKVNKSTQAEEVIIDTDLYPLNITRNVVEKETYATLPTRLLNDAFSLAKNNTLYYTYGSKNINIGQTFGVFDTQTVFSNLLQSVLPSSLKKDFDIPEDADWIGFSQLFDDGTFQWQVEVALLGNFQTGDFLNRWKGLFRLKYIPVLPSIRYEVVRDDVSEVFIDTKSIANQKLRIVDLERFTNNMKGRINQLGNSELILSHKVGSFNETWNIGDFTTEGFVITKKESIVERDHYIINYELNRNFNKMSQFMGIDQEIRQWEIGEKGRTLDRDLNYNEFIEVYADDNGRSDTGSSTIINPSILLNTVNPSYSGQNFAKYSLFTSPQLLDENDNQVVVNLPLYRVSGGNAFGFYMDFETNASAGDQLLEGDNEWYNFEEFRRYNTPFKYTDQVGRLESFLISVHDGTLFPENDFDDENLAAELLPVFTKTISNQFMSGSFYVEKDNRERLKMTFLYHILSKNLDEVVIGELFTTNNSFFIEEPNSVRLRMWNNRKFITRDKNSKLTDQDAIISSPSITFDYEENYFEVPNDVLGYDAWALTDADGYPYIMVNSDKRRIVFEFKGQRSGVDYGGQENLERLRPVGVDETSITSDTISFNVGNVNDETVDIEVTLGSEVQTKEVAANTVSDFFTFDQLDPNTNYTFSITAKVKLGSELTDSTPRTQVLKTNIIPIDPPIVEESRVESYDFEGVTKYIAYYNITNTDDTFALDPYHEIDGFNSITTASASLDPGETAEFAIALLGSDQQDPDNRLDANTTYNIRFRFRTTEFNNNWFSPFTNLQGLFIGELEDPNFGVATATDTTASFSWGNPNDVDTQIEVQLLSAPFPQGTVEQTKTQAIGAQGGTTVTFTGLDDDTFYGTRAKLLGTGFSVESGTVDSSTVKTDVSRTATPRIQNVQRTTSSISFDLFNQDDEEVDIYWNTTGSPDENDNVLSNILSGQVGSDEITGLNEAEIVTIYYTAKSDVNPISTVGSSTTQTFRQLQAPTFNSASSTDTTISASFNNPNSVNVTMSGYVSILGNIVDTDSVSVDANSSNSLNFNNLNPDTEYFVTAKFESSGINLESSSTTSPKITTQKETTEPPLVTNITPAENSVSFDVENDDEDFAVIRYGTDTQSPSLQTQQVAPGSSVNLTVSGLSSGTDYTLAVEAQADGKFASSLVEEDFTTLTPPGTQFVYIGEGLNAFDEDESNNLSELPLPTTCPTLQEMQTLAENELSANYDATNYLQGYIIRFTYTANSPLRNCWNVYYEVQ